MSAGGQKHAPVESRKHPHAEEAYRLASEVFAMLTARMH